jgi:hypothetical protein
VTPQNLVLAASFRGDPVDVVLGVFGWRTRRSRRRPVAEVGMVRTRAPSSRAHGNDPTRAITRQGGEARRGVPSARVGTHTDRDAKG